MKTTAVCLLLLFAAFPLAGLEISIYVPPVQGAGIGPGDNSYIRNLLYTEIAANNYVLAENPGDADYSLTGTITDEGQYILRVVLRDNNTGEIKAEQSLAYNTLNEIDTFFTVLLSEIFSGLTRDGTVAGGDSLWRDREWYFGGGVFWTPKVYVKQQPGGEQSSAAYFTSYGFGLAAEYHFKKYFSAEAGFEFAPDAVTTTSAWPEDMLLSFPLMFKFVIKPSSHFMLEPYTGLHFNISLMRALKPAPVSWMIGFQYGVKAGPGVLFVDPRFSIDLGRPSGIAGSDTTYHRYTVHIGAGYKYGMDFKYK